MVPCDAITIPIVDLAPWKEDARKVNEPLSSNAFHSGSPSGPSGPRPGLASGPIFPSPGFTLRQQPFLHRYPHILDNPQKRSSHDSFFKYLTTQATKGQPSLSQEEQGEIMFVCPSSRSHLFCAGDAVCPPSQPTQLQPQPKIRLKKSCHATVAIICVNLCK